MSAAKDVTFCHESAEISAMRCCTESFTRCSESSWFDALDRQYIFETDVFAASCESKWAPSDPVAPVRSYITLSFQFIKLDIREERDSL